MEDNIEYVVMYTFKMISIINGKKMDYQVSFLSCIDLKTTSKK